MAHAKQITVVAIRHSVTNSAEEAGGDIKRSLTDKGSELAQSVSRELLSRHNFVPEVAYVTSADRTWQTAEQVAPRAVQNIVKFGYPGAPDYQPDFEKVLETECVAACEMFGTSNLSVDDMRQVGSSVDVWLKNFREALFEELNELPDDITQVLVVSHGPSAYGVLSPAFSEIKGEPCSGVIATINPNDGSVSWAEPLRAM